MNGSGINQKDSWFITGGNRFLY
ncbi:hypothetical protein CAEBREN_15127 [Caenorhabditis brenneri]|uniref:Uncharacterized protein n=1 Tax=Caenorhabditis brenneri TaxID=135651 RepID=G0NH08_CAEBE|nr:hypothetical protein CAEBREN_15127 [Caenorhabditis brenneri]